MAKKDRMKPTLKDTAPFREELPETEPETGTEDAPEFAAAIDERDKLPSDATAAVRQALAPIDYLNLARRCLRASTGHGFSGDRELLSEAAVALAELGGFDLEG